MVFQEGQKLSNGFSLCRRFVCVSNVGAISCDRALGVTAVNTLIASNPAMAYFTSYS
jgi:hypothetical protein